MKERPILMSAPMVRAILAGTKTQTRRIVKGVPADAVEVVPSLLANRGDLFDFRRDLDNPVAIRCPFGARGDRLWVKETHAIRSDVEPKTDPDKARHYLLLRADHDGDLGSEWHHYGRWRPSIHMPRWASRITLEITEIRVQRLQDISERDIIAEGVDVPLASKVTGTPWSDIPDLFTAWRLLWDHINGDRAPWSSNPWVWAISFKRVEQS